MIGKRGLFVFGVVFMLLILSVSFVSAATYYVSPSGNDNNPGTQSQTWRTFKKAFAGANSGDTVYFAEGTYLGNVSSPNSYEYDGPVRGGTSWANPTRFMAIPGAQTKPKWVFPGIPGSTNNNGFFFSGTGSRYIIIDGLEFDGGTNYDAQDMEHIRVLFKPNSGAAYIRWNNTDIHGAWHSNFQLPDDTTLGAGYNEILNSHIHHSGGVTYDHGPADSDPSEHHNIYIAGGRNNLVENNTMDHTTGNDVSIYGNDPDYNIVRNNILMGRASGVFDGINNVFYNNIFINSTLQLWYWPINTSVYNNIFIGGGPPGGHGIDFQNVDSARIWNNIFQNAADFTFYTTVGNISITNNVLSRPLSSPSSDVLVQNNIVSSNPLFVNSAGGDYHLQAGSPAVNMGRAITDAAPSNLPSEWTNNKWLDRDRDKVTRPQGGVWDAGVYEYLSGGGPTQYTLTVTNSGTGGGTITGTGINCGVDCSEIVNSGTQITLTATANASSTFASWSGASCSGTGTCIVTMSSAQTVTATFNAAGQAPPQNQTNQSGGTTAGLVAYWKFDESSGTVASDSSGNNNTGNLTNGPVFAAGKFGNALQLDGVNDYVRIGDLDFSPITISLWTKQDVVTSGWHSVVMKPYTYGFETNGQNMYFGIGNGATWSAEPSIPFTLGQWEHIAAAFDGSTITMYKNGVQTGTPRSATLTNSNTQLLIGSWNGAELFAGAIDDVRIYNRTLSAGEIGQLFTGVSASNPGDLNGDNVVNLLDLTIITQDWGKTSGYDARADQNGDGTVNLFDIMAIVQYWGRTY
jgi:hypothetical protein